MNKVLELQGESRVKVFSFEQKYFIGPEEVPVLICKFNRVRRDGKESSFHRIVEKFQLWISHQNKTIVCLDEKQVDDLIYYIKKNQKIFTQRVFVLNQPFLDKDENSKIFGFSHYTDLTVSMHSLLYASKNFPYTGYFACIIQERSNT